MVCIATSYTHSTEDVANAGSPESKLIGGGAVLENQEMAKKASPLTYITKDDPPVFLVHGALDKTVPVQQAKAMHEAYQKLKIESVLHVIEGASHTGPWPQEVNDGVNAFFDKHLKGQK